MNAQAIIDFVKERDEAFIDFVKTGDLKKVYAFSARYGVNVPEDETVVKVGIYKAVQECTSIPLNIKTKAALKCMEMGFNPIIRWHDVEEVEE